MLKTVLSISGKPGLYKLVSRAKNMLVVETISSDKKRLPVYGNEQATSLGDITMYTEDGDKPLGEVLAAIKEKENGAEASLDLKKATAEQFRAYFAEVLPNFDRERVYTSDIKKLLSWYNILVANGMDEFVVKSEDTQKEE